MSTKTWMAWVARGAAALILLVAAGPAMAQFNSGSTGADNALDVQANTTLPVPADGLFNYTTINVASGMTLTFDNATNNVPIIMLATGDVTISGAINLNGANGLTYSDSLAGMPGSEAKPGPGGYPGGIGGVSPINTGNADSAIGASGGGPGGGAASLDNTAVGANLLGRGGNSGSHFTSGAIGTGNASPAAPTYGDMRLLTLTGGSGGAGGNCVTTQASLYEGPGGGGGAGSILIASSTSITVNGTILARGGQGGGGWVSYGGGSEGSGSGAGGAIRLMANSIGGSGSLDARGGSSGFAGGNGLIRIEALNFTDNLVANSNPVPSTSTPTFVSLLPSQQPSIKIISIAGQTVPQNPTGYPATPDVTIPAATANPVTINIETTNVPNGAIVNLRITLENGEILTVNSTAVNNNAATASVSIPEGTGVVYATATFN